MGTSTDEIMGTSTKERQLIDSVKERRREDLIMPKKLVWMLRILLPLDIILVTLVLVLLAFHTDMQYTVKATKQAQELAVEKLVCVLRIPLEERTDENVRVCLEYQGSKE